nr:hypothetical protein [uncultured Roseateles sp.]
MSNATPAVSNPFPAEAVATYGATTVNCSKLEYMQQVHVELSGYLQAYAVDDARFGGAIGLRGAHGSGKTHVLNWLSALLRETKSIRGTALYGKCDSSQLFDLCQQLMKQLDRPLLIELIQLALLKLARDKVRSAKVTEFLEERLLTVGGLQTLQDERNIDLEQLRQQLLAELQAATGTPDIARVLLDLPDARLGADAHLWLTGEEVADLERLGVNYQLRPSDNVANADAIAIMALETIAALHRLAGVPLLVLVDQLEVLVRTPDAAAFESLGSLFKKFIEQLGKQSAMTFVAGIPEAWDKLMRDVPARFRQRAQITVGGLNRAEIRLLLDAYMLERPSLSLFTETAVATIHDLSGGIPREVLRIAHHAFNETAGEPALADARVLLKSARRAGSIDDRVRVMLATIDGVAPSHGFKPLELAVNGQVIDRALSTADGQVVLVILAVKATDPLDEIDSARRVRDMLGLRDAQWARAELLTVTVGYSSQEVVSLLQGSGTTIAFAEKTFEPELRTFLLALTGRRAAVRAQPATTAVTVPDRVDEPVLTDSVKKITARLLELEQRRNEESTRIQERFAAKTEALAAPAMAERSLTTRREVLDALESLREALTKKDAARERQLLRAILVANEAYLSNAQLEDLGELYLESLTLESLNSGESANRTDRVALIGDMRDALRRPDGWRELLGRPRQLLAAMGGLLLAFLASSILSSYRERPSEYRARLLGLPAPDDFLSMLPFLFLFLATVVAYLYAGLWLGESRRRSLNRRRLLELRDAARKAESAPKLGDKYPQT